MRDKIVHMVGDEEDAKLTEGEVREVRTRCGRAIVNPVVVAVNKTGLGYHLIARNGNQFFCATRAASVTCVKCRNLLTMGTIYAQPSRPANAQKRAVANAHPVPARAARAHARPRA